MNLKGIDVRKRAEARNKGLYLEGVREDFKRKLMKCFQTDFIGSINIFENEFGHLWGLGKSYDDLTLTEREWRKVWERVRKALLDNGNKQLRTAQDEINKYDLEPTEQVKLPLRRA